MNEWINDGGAYRAAPATPGLVKRYLKVQVWKMVPRCLMLATDIRSPGPAMLGPGGTDSPCFCMGQDCLWDSEEQKGVKADLLIAVVWDETVSGTARIKTQVFLKVDALNSWSPPCCSMAQNCLWDSEEPHIGFAPRCPRGSFVPYKSEEHISCTVHSQSCSSLSQRQSCPI